MKESGTIYYYITDRLGNVRYVLDSSGVVVQSYFYSPFGQLHSSTGNLNQPYQYVGGEFYYTEEGTNLQLLGQRWYDAEVGRFISRDPISVFKNFIFFTFPLFRSDIFHKYTYGYNNPLVIVDPHGLAGQKAGCDKVGWIPWPPPFWNANRCIHSCCDQHDECYAENGCIWHSWAFILTPECENKCDKCNREVVICIMGCFIHPGLWGNYYRYYNYNKYTWPWIERGASGGW